MLLIIIPSGITMAMKVHWLSGFPSHITSAYIFLGKTGYVVCLTSSEGEHLKPIRMATIKKNKQKITGIGKDVKKLEPSYTVDGNVK